MLIVEFNNQRSASLISFPVISERCFLPSWCRTHLYGVYVLTAQEPKPITTTNSYLISFPNVRLEITTTMDTLLPCLPMWKIAPDHLMGYKHCFLYLGCKPFDIPESFREQMNIFNYRMVNKDFSWFSQVPWNVNVSKMHTSKTRYPFCQWLMKEITPEIDMYEVLSV